MRRLLLSLTVLALLTHVGDAFGQESTAPQPTTESAWILEYAVINLAPPGTVTSDAHGINILGQVVGSAAGVDEQSHAFVWQADSGWRNLGPLDRGCSFASAVNDAGLVVGTAQPAGGQGGCTDPHSFVWDAPTGMRELGGSFSGANAINNSGLIVGVARVESPRAAEHAVLWDTTRRMHDLGTLPGDYKSYAWGINDSGQVVGFSESPDGSQRAMTWTAQSGMQQLGTLGGRFSSALAINNSGSIVGLSQATIDPIGHALLWDDATLASRELSLAGYSLLPGAINDSGQVIGAATSTDIEHRTEPFLWDEEHGGRLLNELLAPADADVWRISSARAITADGQIVGFGNLERTGRGQAVLLIPRLRLPSYIQGRSSSGRARPAKAPAGVDVGGHLSQRRSEPGS